MTGKQSKYDQAVIRPIISLKVEGYYPEFKDEITLVEETHANSRSYYFEMRSSVNPKYIGKRTISSIEINELLYHVKDLNLPRDPEQEMWTDVPSYTLKIYGKQYIWDWPLPKEWKPLEKVVDRLEDHSEFEKFREECWKALRLERLNVINLKKHHPYSLQKGFVVYKKNMEPAGMYYRIGEVREFVKMKNNWLELERDPHNQNDPNAIKVIGRSKELPMEARKHIGYIPRELAAIIVILDLYNHIIPYLHWTYYDYRTNTILITFDLAGPVTKWGEFGEALRAAEYETVEFTWD